MLMDQSSLSSRASTITSVLLDILHQEFLKVVSITISSILLTECKRGEYMDEKICIPCPIGTYMSERNTNASCNDCEDGKTTEESGSRSALKCIGKFGQEVQKPELMPSKLIMTPSFPSKCSPKTS